jgi:hypothetical protein
LAFTPLFPVGGSKYVVFRNIVYPLGFNFSVGCYPFQFGWGNLGLDLDFSFVNLFAQAGGQFTDGMVLSLGGNIKYTPPFHLGNMDLEIKIGGGQAQISRQTLVDNTGSSSLGDNVWAPYLEGGLGAALDFREERLSLNLGLSVSVLFPRKDTVVTLKPILGLSWRF